MIVLLIIGLSLRFNLLPAEYNLANGAGLIGWGIYILIEGVWGRREKPRPTLAELKEAEEHGQRVKHQLEEESRRKEILTTKQKKHEQDILQVLNAHVSEKGRVDYSEPVITPRYFDWASHNEMYPYCISHLKCEKYAHIYELLGQAEKYANERVSGIAQETQKYRDYIDEKLEAFTALPASDKFLGYNKSHFVRLSFRGIIFQNIESIQRYGTRINPYGIDRGNPSRLSSGGTTFAIGDDDSLTELKMLAESLESDTNLVSLLGSIDQLNAELHLNDALDDFEIERSKLVLELDKGQRELEGHCELCPSL